MGLYLRGLITGRIFASEIWGAYFREGLFFFFFGGGEGYYRNFTVHVTHLKKALTCLRGLWKMTCDINMGAAICQL